MTRDEAVDLILARLRRKNDTSLRDDVIQEMDHVITTKLEQGSFLPWFLISSEKDMVTVVGSEEVTPPTGFLREWEDGPLYYYDTSQSNPYVELVKDDYAFIKQKYTISGPPQAYDLVGMLYLVRPVPDLVYALKQRVYVKDTSIAGVYGDAANVENSWLAYASDLIMGEVGLLMTQHIDAESQIVQNFASLQSNALQRLYTLDTLRKEELKSRSMGD